MPSLPFTHRATVDIRKLRDYCLDPTHESRGQYKARVFQAALGLSVADADWLRDEILRLLPLAQAIPAAADGYGLRYNVDLPIARLDRRAVIRTSWILEPGDDRPRLISCRVL